MLASLVVLAPLATACGGDDAGPQAELGDVVIELFAAFQDEGEIKLDEGCATDIINDMSDEAAQEALDNLDTPDYEGFDSVGEQIEAECMSASS